MLTGIATTTPASVVEVALQTLLEQQVRLLLEQIQYVFSLICAETFVMSCST